MRAAAIVDEQFLAEQAAAGLYSARTLWDLASAASPGRIAVVCPTNGEITYGTLIQDAVAGASNARCASCK